MHTHTHTQEVDELPFEGGDVEAVLAEEEERRW